MGWDVETPLPEAVSESSLWGATPKVDKGEVFLDCLLGGVGASEPSLDDDTAAAAAAVTEGLSVLAAFGEGLGAIAMLC